jgi:hypothetical protein
MMTSWEHSLNRSPLPYALSFFGKSDLGNTPFRFYYFFPSRSLANFVLPTFFQSLFLKRADFGDTPLEI